MESETDWAGWLVGLFYIRENLDYRDAIRFGSDFEGYANGIVSGNPLSGFYSGLTDLPPGQVFPEGDGVVEDSFLQQVEMGPLYP